MWPLMGPISGDEYPQQQREQVEVCETTKMRYCGRPPDPTRARILTVPTELPEEEASKIRSAG
jgi:hypothetical protein